VSAETDVETLIASNAERHAQLDCLVNCAGDGGAPGGLAETGTPEMTWYAFQRLSVLQPAPTFRPVTSDDAGLQAVSQFPCNGGRSRHVTRTGSEKHITDHHTVTPPSCPSQIRGGTAGLIPVLFLAASLRRR
jgi:hypothetical protein